MIVILAWLINVLIGAFTINSLLPNIGGWELAGLIWMWCVVVGTAYREI